MSNSGANQPGALSAPAPTSAGPANASSVRVVKNRRRAAPQGLVQRCAPFPAASGTLPDRPDVDQGRGTAGASPPPADTGEDAVGSTPLKIAPRWRRAGRYGLQGAAAVAVVVVLVNERGLIASSLRVVGHLTWGWLVLAMLLEWTSMASFAHLQCRLLRAGRAKVGLLPMLATVYAGNALSSSVPFAGSQMSVVFVFRRFKQLGVEATVAGWTLAVAGVISSLASAVLLGVGAVLTGNDFLAATGAVAAIAEVAVLVAATAALRSPAILTALERPVGWILRRLPGTLGRPGHEPVVATLAGRLGSLRLPPLTWVAIVGAALLNWLADIGVLAASIAAVGAAVPWRGLLFAYGLGTAAGSVGVIPGGIGLVEAALAVSLMGAGVRHPLALAAVLVYRLVSYWMVVSVGWLIYLLGGRSRPTPGRLAGGGPSGPPGSFEPPEVGGGRPLGADLGVEGFPVGGGVEMSDDGTSPDGDPDQVEKVIGHPEPSSDLV
jgi:putative heme transporter